MDPNWKDEFAPQVLARGRKYYEEGRVSQIFQSGNRITAHVNGTADYCVEIELPGGVPDSWMCTCPYSTKDNCKHKAAVLYAIEAGEYVFSDEDCSETIEIDLWQEAINNLPEDILRKELLLDRYNKRLQERLEIRYLGAMPKGMLLEWKRRLSNYGRTARLGFNKSTEEDVSEFLHELDSVIEDRVMLLMEVGATLDAFFLLGAVYTTAVDTIVLDPENELSAFTFWCSNLWCRLVMMADEKEQEQMLQWFWKNRTRFFKNAESALDVDFIDLPWSEKILRESMEIIDSWIPRYSECKELELLIDCRIEIMDILKCPDEEILHFFTQHLNLNCTRHSLLTVLDVREKNEEILALLKKFKEIDRNDMPRLIQDNVWLAQMYDKLGEHKKHAATMKWLHSDCKKMLESELPNVVDKASARRFIACLTALREIQTGGIPELIETLVNRLCSNPAIARKGIVELVNAAGFEWPKAYNFLP